ncbi:MAG: HlyD family efflux transporter periplasmic adaptor subunit [Holophagales bacterium]|nr:HlyD family efflux transporter periplasmic adaptor subunit [Holophagales bacterium]MYG29004.1 HlyD family efflux transporter periplasmic adaptor subunit [Holophagales bacterium]MYI80676.1 HlyD family efflux transporter periplasmic adaptor subunit [Holophagales bacterium]
MKTRRWVLWGVGLVVVAAAVFFGTRPQPVPAELAEVTRGPLEVTVDDEGETRVRDRFVISAPLAGRVLRIELEPGDAVVAGETVLAIFLPSAPVLLDARSRAEAEAAVETATAALGQAEANYERSAAELVYSRSEAGRYLRLSQEGIVSVETMESAQLDLDTRQEAVEAADYAVRTARSELQAARVRLLQFSAESAEDMNGTAIRIVSPVSGVVLRRVRESESVVPAGEALLEVGDPAQIEVVTDYLSKDAVRMRSGQRVLIDRWGGDRPLLGRLRRVEPSGFTKISALGVEEQRVNVVIDIVDPPAVWAGLGDGFRVETRVVVWESGDELKAPTGALFRRDESWAVFAVERGRAALRMIDVGERNAREAQVLAGLEPGEQVVVYPSDSLSDGSPVAAEL